MSLLFLSSQITLVGVIRNMEKSMTNIQYKVDDMTGPPMDVKQWVDTEVSEPVLQLVKSRGSIRKGLLSILFNIIYNERKECLSVALGTVPCYCWYRGINSLWQRIYASKGLYS